MALRVGIISANWGAFAHLPGWRGVPGIEVVGICTSRRETAEAAAQRTGIPRAFWNAEEMAADPEIDIVDVGTRPTLRETMALAALGQGKHVYLGIPFAAGLDGARAQRDAWRASGKVGVLDAYLEWVPALRLAKEMIDEDYLGRPFGGTCVFNMGLYNPLTPGFPYNWFAEKDQGVSAVRNLGSHALHLLVHLFGPVAEVVAHDGQLLDRWTSADGGASITAETNDFASMLLRFASGMVIQFQVSWNATLGPGWMLDIFGSRGRILTQAPSFPTSRDTTLHAGNIGGGMAEIAIPDRLFRSSDVAIDADFPVPPAYPMALSMNAMARAIEGEGRAHPDFAQAWEVERLQEAVRLSQAERRWVALAGIG